MGSLVHSEHKAWENNRQVDMFCCYHQPSPDKSSISNQCQGKGKSGREWVVPGEGGRGRQGSALAEGWGREGQRGWWGVDGRHIAHHQTKQ